MFSLTIETFNSNPAVFTYPTLEAVLEHMAADLSPWFQPDDWRAELGAILSRHGETGLVTDDLEYTITKH